MSRIDPNNLGEQISAYLDGELSPAERDAVESRLRSDSAARAMLAELRRNAEALGGLPRHSAPPGLVDDVAAHVERSQLLGSTRPAKPSHGPPSGMFRSLLLTAAMVAIAVGGGLWGILQTEDGGPSVQVVDAKKRSVDVDELEELLIDTPSALDARAAQDPPSTAAKTPSRKHMVGREARDVRTTPARPTVLSPRRLDDQIGAEGREEASAAAKSESMGIPSVLGSDVSNVTNSVEAASDSRQQLVFARQFRQQSQLVQGSPRLELDVACADESAAIKSAGRLDRFVADQGLTPRRGGRFSARRTLPREQVVQVRLSQLPALAEMLRVGQPKGGEVTLSSEGVTQATGWSQVQYVLAVAGDAKADKYGYSTDASLRGHFARPMPAAPSASGGLGDADAELDGLTKGEPEEEKAKTERRDSGDVPASRTNEKLARRADRGRAFRGGDGSVPQPAGGVLIDPIVEVVVRFLVPPRSPGPPIGTRRVSPEDPKSTP